jgi:hypothetical protein
VRRAVILLATVIVISTGSTTGGAAAPSRAQQATPTSDKDVPAAEECLVTPRTANQVASALGTPAVVEATPLAPSVASEAALPQGTATDAATTEAVAKTAREFLACVNAGDNFRSLALVSDTFLRRQLGGAIPTSDQLAALRSQLEGAAAASPVPLARDKQGALVEVRDARMLPDGRVGAVVVVDSAVGAPSQESALFLFSKGGTRWLVDEIIVVKPDAEATPAS